MKLFAIVIKDHPLSEHGYSNLWESAKQYGMKIERFDAVKPEDAIELTHKYGGLFWSWPWQGEELDIPNGIRKIAYPTNNPYARVACFLSHYSLWKKCVELNESIVILEHDAQFIRPILSQFEPANGTVVSINDPRGCTRKSALYHKLLSESEAEIPQTPWIDSDRSIAQGLPGNSAYIISPQFAKDVIEKTKEVGMWPNDALICKQLFPGKLYSCRVYCTRVQGLPSTTSL